MKNTSGNPFENIDLVENSQELLDIAFDKAMKIKPPNGRMGSLERSRSHELNRINTAANVLVDRIERIIHQFPSMDNIHPFYQEMADLYLGVDQIKISLGRIHGIVDHIRSIQNDLSVKFNSTYHKSEHKQLRKQAFGRFSSITYQINKFLEDLRVAKIKLSDLPGFDPMLPTVVITGVPNAGKSSFINLTSSGKSEVASYPFTTNEVIFGHRKLKFISIQFVDTPGLLDRDFLDRNDIELQALLALKYLADILVFFIDPTENSSVKLQEQLHLLSEIQEYYPTMVFLVAINKNDLISENRISEITSLLISDYHIEKSAIFNINSKSIAGVKDFLQDIEELILKKVLKSRRFNSLTALEIDPDQLPVEDDPMWDDFAY